MLQYMFLHLHNLQMNKVNGQCLRKLEERWIGGDRSSPRGGKMGLEWVAGDIFVVVVVF